MLATEKALRLPEILRCIFGWLLIVDEPSLRAAGQVDSTWFANVVPFYWKVADSDRIALVTPQRRWIYAPYVRALTLDGKTGMALYYDDATAFPSLRAVKMAWAPAEVSGQANLESFLPALVRERGSL